MIARISRSSLAEAPPSDAPELIPGPADADAEVARCRAIEDRVRGHVADAEAAIAEADTARQRVVDGLAAGHPISDADTAAIEAGAQ